MQNVQVICLCALVLCSNFLVKQIELQIGGATVLLQPRSLKQVNGTRRILRPKTKNKSPRVRRTLQGASGDPERRTARRSNTAAEERRGGLRMTPEEAGPEGMQRRILGSAVAALAAGIRQRRSRALRRCGAEVGPASPSAAPGISPARRQRRIGVGGCHFGQVGWR